jgi:hypothetical protein
VGGVQKWSGSDGKEEKSHHFPPPGIEPPVVQSVALVCILAELPSSYACIAWMHYKNIVINCVKGKVVPVL